MIAERRGNQVRNADGRLHHYGVSGANNASCGHGYPRLVETAVRQPNLWSFTSRLRLCASPPRRWRPGSRSCSRVRRGRPP